MLARDSTEEHRAATSLELFFDLVTVIAIAAVSVSFHHQISHGHGLHTLPKFLLMFLAVWWAWMNYTWLASAFDNDDPIFRLLTIFIMGGAITFAGGASYIFETFDLTIGLIGWIIMRVGLITLWLRVRVHNPKYAASATRYIVGLGLAQTLWIAVYFIFPAGSNAIVVAAATVFGFEILVPVYAERSQRSPWHRHHIIERFGLLNIIVLGEVLVSVGIAVSKLQREYFGLELIGLIISGLAIVFSLWWIYFIEKDHLTGEALGRTILWSYGHYFVYLAGTALGSGLAAYSDVLTHESKIDSITASAYVGVPIALYLIGLWVIRDRFLDLGLRKLALPASGLAIIVVSFMGAQPHILAFLTVAALLWRNTWDG